MNAGKNIDLNPEAQGPGFLASLKSAVPGAKTVLAALSLATASRVAEAATATVEPLPEPLNSIVNDGVNHANALSINERGDAVFQKFHPDGSFDSWYVLPAGATQPFGIEGEYFNLNPAGDGFVGADSANGALWRVDESMNWTLPTPIMDGIDQDGDGRLDRFGDDVAWNSQADRLEALTNTVSWGGGFIQSPQGAELINDGLHEGAADWDSNWHGGATSGRFFYDKEVGDTSEIHYKPADDLSGDSTFVAEGIWPSLSPDGTKVYFGQLNPSTGLYEVKQAVLPETATFYCDSDGDGHGDIAHPFVADSDSIPAGGTFFEYQGVRYVASSDDCDDNWAAHILPTDCNPVEDTDTPEDTVDTEDTPDDTVDTPNDTEDTPGDTQDTPSSHGNTPDIDVRRATGCDTTGTSTEWAFGAAALALAAARRRKSEETDAERRP